MATGFILKVGSIRLPDREGNLIITAHSEDAGFTLSTETVNSWNLFTTSLGHCGYGKISLVAVADEKKVLYCSGCGLRIEIPVATATIGDLRKFFETSEKG